MAGRHLLAGGGEAGVGAVNLGDHLGLHGDEFGTGQFAAGGAFGDGALVLIEDGQLQGQAETPLAVAGIAVVPGVAGAEVEVGILFGDLQAEVGLGGGVIGEGAEDIGAAAQGGAAGIGRGEGLRGGGGKIKGQVKAGRGIQADAQRFGEAGAGLGLFGRGIGKIELRAVQGHLGDGQFGSGNGPGSELLLQTLDDFRFGGDLRLEQRGAAAGELEVQQAGADVAAHRPGGGDKAPTGGLGYFRGFGEALAAFAGGFDGDVERYRNEPRTEIARDAGVVAGGGGNRGVGPGTGGFETGGGELPLGAGDGEVGMKIERGEREGF